MGLCFYPMALVQSKSKPLWPEFKLNSTYLFYASIVITHFAIGELKIKIRNKRSCTDLCLWFFHYQSHIFFLAREINQNALAVQLLEHYISHISISFSLCPTIYFCHPVYTSICPYVDVTWLPFCLFISFVLSNSSPFCRSKPFSFLFHLSNSVILSSSPSIFTPFFYVHRSGSSSSCWSLGLSCLSGSVS